MRDVSDEYALLAVQGPNAIERARPGAREGSSRSPRATIDGVEVMVNRTGYTGEDGCELLCMAEDAGALWDAVLARGVTPCGLGARDTLRLEACFPLHGNDITPETDAISAGPRLDVRARQGVHRRRGAAARQGGGARARKLVAFVMEEKAIPRQGMPIEGGGEVTSGSHSPMLDVGIGMGYVPTAQAAPGHRADDRRAREAAQGTRCEEADLQEGGLSGCCGVVSRGAEVPPRARLGAHRRRRGGARHHVVRAGRARRARALRAARKEAPR